MDLDFFQKLAMIGAIVLPLWNIPLIYRIVRLKTSENISLSWALGVWACLLLMAPAGFVSHDLIFRIYNITNLVLFSLVVFVVLFYRKKSPS